MVVMTEATSVDWTVRERPGNSTLLIEREAQFKKSRGKSGDQGQNRVHHYKYESKRNNPRRWHLSDDIDHQRLLCLMLDNAVQPKGDTDPAMPLWYNDGETGYKTAGQPAIMTLLILTGGS